VRERCEVPNCRGEVGIVYLDRGVCDDCWNEYMREDAPPDALRMVLGIGTDAPTAREEAMAETKKGAKPKAATKKARAEKPAKPKRERAPKEDLVVFACRVAEAERVKFHEATGPAGASRFARKLMVVFANEDEAGFKGLLKEAREARA